MSSQSPPLTTAEAQAAAQVLQALCPLSAEQAERVLAHVQARLDEQHEHDVRPLFARGIAGPLGKLDREIKTRIDEHTHTLFLQHCVMRNTDASSVVRDCVYALVHGKTYGQMVLERINHDAQRSEALAKLIGPFGATQSSGVPQRG